MAAQPFDWIGYFTLADELSRRADEASLRSAMSRAYYYVYQLALQSKQTPTALPTLPEKDPISSSGAISAIVPILIAGGSAKSHCVLRIKGRGLTIAQFTRASAKTFPTCWPTLGILLRAYRP